MSPYLRGIPHLPEPLVSHLGERRAVSPADAATLDRDIAVIKARIRARREAWERQSGQIVEVEPVTK